MRRSDLINLGQTQEHMDLVSKTEFTLCYEVVIVLYLTTCVYFLRNDYEDGENKHKACFGNPRMHILHFIMCIMWPTVLGRLLVYLKYRRENYH